MTDLTRIWRLPLPDDWEPTETWCVTFPIPAGDQYVEALRAAIGLLTISKTFERDETHTGASTVAHTWQKLMYSKAMLVEQNECGYAPPVNSPILTTPEQKADYSATTIKFIQQALLAPFVTCAGLGTPCEDCVTAVMIDLAPYGSGDQLRAALMNICTAVRNATPAQINAAQQDCLYADEFADLSSKVGNPFDWLNNLAGWLFAWLNNTSSELFNALNQAAGIIGGSGINQWIDDNGGVTPGSGAGFGGDCTWQHTWDFTSANSDWYALVGMGEPAAAYVGGVGWVDVLPTWTGGLRFNYIVLDVENVTHVDVVYDMQTGPSQNVGEDIRIAAGPNFTGGTLSEATDNLSPGTSYSNRSFGADVSSGGGSILLSQNGMVSLVVKQVTVFGNGPDPFA